MRNKLFLLSSLLIVTSMILGACVTPTPEKTVITETPAHEMPAEFKSADPGTLYYVALSEGIDTLDPAWNYESEGDAAILNIYEQLVTYNGPDATTFVPALAESWEVSEDGTTYVFHIRQGAKFHEGQDLTASDVAYSLQRGVLQGGTFSPQWLFTEPLFGTGIYDIAELVDDTGALDDDPEGLQAADPEVLASACQQVVEAMVADDAAGTFTMHLVQPWAPLLATLAQSWGSIMDEDWAIEHGAWDGDCATWQNYYGVTSETSPLRDVINGTGPYKLDHWTPGEEVVFVANDAYWRVEQDVPFFEGAPAGPQIPRVVKSGVTEWGTRFAMMQTGDADFTDVPRENATQIDPLVGVLCEWDAAANQHVCAPTENPGGPLQLYKGHPLTSRTDAMFVFDVNVEGGNPYVGSGELDGNGIPADFFSDIHVRKAFNYCFDWDAFIANALAGEAVQNVGPLIPGILGYDPDGPKYSYDPDMCASEMEQAWDGQVAANGFRMQVAFNTGNITRQTVAQILQTGLGDIDAKYKVEIIGLPWPSFLAAIRGSRLPLYISGWQEDIHDPHNWAQPFLVGAYANRQVLPAEMVTQFKEKVSAGVAATTDVERATIYKEIAQMDYDNAIAIRLAVPTGRFYQQRWIGGYFYNPIWQFDSHYFSFTKQ